jgi:hypothetical protein
LSLIAGGGGGLLAYAAFAWPMVRTLLTGRLLSPLSSSAGAGRGHRVEQ